MKVRDVIRALLAAGWVQVRQESSHRVFKKDGAQNNVVINGHDSDDLSPGVLSKVRRETGVLLR